MKLNPHWLKDEDIVALLAACVRQDIALRFVGGAVRDTVLMREVGDIDAATPVHAQQVMERLQREGIKIVPTGLKHGTVTAVLKQRHVEITTLRVDVETDGRHAVVAPTLEWEVDAARRDFTMNALYLTPEGALFDYYDGAEDALHGRVRFIGDAAKRIAEDGLRILRFFRFVATHGEPPVDANALDACRDAHWVLEEISGERIAQEMKKLLVAHNPTLALRLMEESNVAAHVFSQPLRLGVLVRLTMLEHTAGVRAGVWARCAALVQDAGGTPHPNPSSTKNHGVSHDFSSRSPEGEGIRSAGAVQWIATRWRLANKEAAQLELLVTLPRLKEDDARWVHTRVMRLHGVEMYRDLLLLSAAENGAFALEPWVALSRKFVTPVLPVNGEDMKAKGIAPGADMGEVLKRLELAWEMSDYQLTKSELLRQL